MTNLQWFCLRSMTGGELKAVSTISDLGRRRVLDGKDDIVPYVPVETGWRRIQAAKQPPQRRQTPLFRGYVFVLCTAADVWLTEDCDGVSGIWRNLATNAPLTVSAKDVLDLQARELRGSFDYTRDKKGRDAGKGAMFRPKEGQHVKLTLLETTGVIVKVQHPGRVLVMPDTGLRFPTSVHIRDMELLEAEPTTAELEAA